MDRGLTLSDGRARTKGRPAEVSFKVGDAAVRYVVGSAADAALGQFLSGAVGRGGAVGIVHDRTVAGFVDSVLVPVARAATDREPLALALSASEPAKRMASVERLARRLWDLGLRHDGALVAVGGGITLNVAGLTAALFLRGVPLVSVPTTLLAAVDGVVSAKQGVNSGRVRNGLGSYLPPALVVAPLEVFATLPAGRRADAMFELSKNVLIGATPRSEPIAEWRNRILAGEDEPGTWHDMIVSGVRAKAPFLAVDPHEHGEALIFEYGHTVAHWLEMGGARLSHGAAVGVGMVAAAHAAEARGLPALEAHRELLAPLLAGLDLVELPSPDHLLWDRKRSSRVGDDRVPMLLSDGMRCVPSDRGSLLWLVPLAEVHRAAAAAASWTRPCRPRPRAAVRR